MDSNRRMATLRAASRHLVAPATLRRAAPCLGGARRLCSNRPDDDDMADGEIHPVMLRRVAALDALHCQQTAVEEEHLRQLRKLEEALIENSGSIQRRRHEIVSGVAEPTDEEVTASQIVEAPPVPPGAPEVPAGVPRFWEMAMRNCDSLQPMTLDDAIDDDYSDGEQAEPVIITEADWSVLAHLENVTVQTWEPPPEEWESELGELGGGSVVDDLAEEEVIDEEQSVGFSLHFRFAPNDFLEGDELALYCYTTGEVAETTPPVWRDGRDVTVRMRTKKIKRKGRDAERVSVAKPVDSFFRAHPARPNARHLPRSAWPRRLAASCARPRVGPRRAQASSRRSTTRSASRRRRTRGWRRWRCCRRRWCCRSRRTSCRTPPPTTSARSSTASIVVPRAMMRCRATDARGPDAHTTRARARVQSTTIARSPFEPSLTARAGGPGPRPELEHAQCTPGSAARVQHARRRAAQKTQVLFSSDFCVPNSVKIHTRRNHSTCTHRTPAAVAERHRANICSDVA